MEPVAVRRGHRGPAGAALEILPMRKSLFAAALTASLLGGPAGQSSLFDPLFAFFSAIWDGQSLDAGCGWDPNGRCDVAPQPQLDEGCGWDPDGRCHSGS